MQRAAENLLRKLRLVRTNDAARRPLPLPQQLIALNSPEGGALLTGCGLAGDYLRLMPHYVPQEDPKFCGPATMAICLNALHLPPPPGADPVRPQFTQRNVFTTGTEAVRSSDKVAREGMGLAVIAQFVEAHGGKADVRFAGESNLETFRTSAIEVLGAPDRFLVVNYLRRALWQEGRGHTSPVAAYDEGTDRFLVLDVSRVAYPPAWVRAGDLFAAMNTSAGANTRGYALVGRA